MGCCFFSLQFDCIFSIISWKTVNISYVVEDTREVQINTMKLLAILLNQLIHVISREYYETLVFQLKYLNDTDRNMLCMCWAFRSRLFELDCNFAVQGELDWGGGTKHKLRKSQMNESWRIQLHTIDVVFCALIGFVSLLNARQPNILSFSTISLKPV